jgi:hypothetical protein
MNLVECTTLVKKAVTLMNEAYGRPVFDEWAVVNLQPISGTILEYSGPRLADFQNHFLENLVPLRDEMNGGDLEPGDFAFAREAAGPDFDASIVLGKNLYLLFNHTEKDMEGITKDPLWKKAQQPFVNLSEQFRRAPLDLV